MQRPSSAHIWSAVPTPLSPDLRVDEAATAKMVEAAVKDGIEGVFLAGTCGEGPWLQDRERKRLLQAAVQAAGGRLKIAMQVSDTSLPRIVDNITMARDHGADLAVIAPPLIMLNATDARIVNFYERACDASQLPIGLYDLGRHRSIVIPEAALGRIYQHPNVQLVKDSSGSPARRDIALAARQNKPALKLYNGNEFACVDYLKAGYDGCMFGGAVATAPHLQRIFALFRAGELAEAEKTDAEMRAILYGIYGGESLGCWLTGLKYYMVCRGLFPSTDGFLEYPLADDCRNFVQYYARTGQLPPASSPLP